MSTADVVPYLHWKNDVAEHDYDAASSYLSIRFGERRAGAGGGGTAEAPGHYAAGQ